MHCQLEIHMPDANEPCGKGHFMSSSFCVQLMRPDAVDGKAVRVKTKNGIK